MANNTTTMENSAMTLEEYIAIFGTEEGAAMFADQEAAKGSTSTGLDLPKLEKISDIASPTGAAFGDYVLGIKKEKNSTTGEYEITDNGENLGKSFQLLPLGIFYQYKKWDEVNKKSQYSSVFKSINEGDTAVDYKGSRLPAGKESKKENGWNMTKNVTCLVRKDAKSDFQPAVITLTGKLFFTYNNVEKLLRQPILGGVLNIVTKLEKQGSTNYSVIDEVKTTADANPADLFTKYKDLVASTSAKTREYVAAKLPKAPAKQAPAHQADESDELPEGSNW